MQKSRENIYHHYSLSLLYSSWSFRALSLWLSYWSFLLQALDWIWSSCVSILTWYQSPRLFLRWSGRIKFLLFVPWSTGSNFEVFCWCDWVIWEPIVGSIVAGAIGSSKNPNCWCDWLSWKKPWLFWLLIIVTSVFLVASAVLLKKKKKAHFLRRQLGKTFFLPCSVASHSFDELLCRTGVNCPSKRKTWPIDRDSLTVVSFSCLFFVILFIFCCWVA